MSAQILLNTFSVETLFEATTEELVKQCPWLSKKILQGFWEYIHNEEELGENLDPRAKCASNTGEAGYHADSDEVLALKKTNVKSGKDTQHKKEYSKTGSYVSQQDDILKDRQRNGLELKYLRDVKQYHQKDTGFDICKSDAAYLDDFKISDTKERQRSKLEMECLGDMKQYHQRDTELDICKSEGGYVDDFMMSDTKVMQHEKNEQELQPDKYSFMSSGQQKEEKQILLESDIGQLSEYSHCYDTPEEMIYIEPTRNPLIDIPNEFERACLERQTENQALEECDFNFQPTITLKEERLEKMLEEKCLESSEDQYMSSRSSHHISGLGSKRFSDWNRKENLPSPHKVPKVEEAENDPGGMPESKEEKYVTSDKFDKNIYADHIEKKYREYPNRSDISLWTQFGDGHQRSSAWQQKKTIHRQNALETALMKGKGKRISKYEEADIQSVLEPFYKENGPTAVKSGKEAGVERSGPRVKEGMSFKHNYTGSKVSGSVSRNDKVETLKDEMDNVERFRRQRSNTPTDGTRRVAPVTPKVRHPVRALQLGTGEKRGQETRRQHEQENRNTTYIGTEQESPPMDLSQADQDLDFYDFGITNVPTEQQVPNSKDNAFSYFQDSMFFEENQHTRQQQARRKLTYEKVPGAAKGQTRLSFVKI